VPLGFCSGGFSSTAGYVPGNEARLSFDASGFALNRLITSDERYPFLSEQLDMPFDSLSKPFGFGSGR
jgi:hypothetical protein